MVVVEINLQKKKKIKLNGLLPQTTLKIPVMWLGNFQNWGVQIIWIKVGQGPTDFAVGAVELFGYLFSRLSFLLFYLPLTEMA